MRTITINTMALQHNLARVRHYAPGRKVLAMLKADAYGHGLLTVAQALKEAEGFGVADLSEALQLRAAGFKHVIVVMRGFYDARELPVFAEYDLSAVVHTEAQIVLLQHTPIAKPISVWLKVDTGMHRLGFAVDKIASAFARLTACASLQQPLCLMTHFADANESNPLTTARQWMQFEQSVRTLPKEAVIEQSLANSAGIISYPEIDADWVRPGIMLYGASPFNDYPASDYDLQAVMTLKARLVSIQEVPCGAAIGYGGTFICPKAMRLGIIAYGYGDGYPCLAPTGTPVLVNGQLTRIIGRISMDLIHIDLSDFPEVALDAEVTLWGEGLPIERIAAAVGTLSYELFCHVQRHRLIKKSE